jgi:hypothetical protein
MVGRRGRTKEGYKAGKEGGAFKLGERMVTKKRGAQSKRQISLEKDTSLSHLFMTPNTKA